MNPTAQRPAGRSARRVIRTLLAATVAAAAAHAQSSTTSQAAAEPFVQPTAADTQLIARVEAAIAAARDSPGREAANYFAEEWVGNQLRRLRGGANSTAREMQIARNHVLNLLRNVERGPDWPRPRRCHVRHATVPMTIDGVLDESAWSNAEPWHPVYAFNETELADGPATTWMLLWDATNLYVGALCQDTNVVAPEMERDGDVFAHDCIEVFLLSEPEFGFYWELVVSPSGAVHDCLHWKHQDRWGSTARIGENIRGLRTAARPLPAEHPLAPGYAVELAVPFDQLPGFTRGAPAPGETLRGMLVRLDQTGATLRAYSFQPLLSWGHNVWNHATLELIP